MCSQFYLFNHKTTLKAIFLICFYIESQLDELSRNLAIYS